MSNTEVISSADVSALARVLLTEHATELCTLCGKTGPWRCAICGTCAPRALRVLSRAYLELADAPEILVEPIEDRWTGAEDEWGSAETRMPATRFADGSQLNATKVASPMLLKRLTRDMLKAPREDATRRSERR